MQLPRVSECFKDQKVFITGATGFIGKVFIEKLLRSCPDVHSVYLLMRPKKGKTVDERIKELTDVPLFDILRKQQPDFEKKIKVIVGDTTEIGLGLNDEDRQFLIDEINSIFHIAATVRFDTSLAEAIFTNTRGTRDLALLALEMKQLRVFQYVSTAYSNINQKIIEEKVYPAQTDWRKTIEICEKLDGNTVNAMTPNYIKPLGNCYTFSKNLAESVVNDLLLGKVPVVIVRPAIVIPTYTDPFPGWIDTMNSPILVVVGMEKGIIRIVYLKDDVKAHYIPVDIVVKDMILASWKKYYERNNKEEISVVNSALCEFSYITPAELKELADRMALENPMKLTYWAYNNSITTSELNYYIQFMLFQYIPSFILDSISRLFGHKPVLCKIQRRLYNTSMLANPFLFVDYTIKVENALALEKSVVEEDKEDFKYLKEEGESYKYISEIFKFIRKYVLHEYDDEGARRLFQRMKLLDHVVKTLFFFLIIWAIFIKFGGYNS